MKTHLVLAVLLGSLALGSSSVMADAHQKEAEAAKKKQAEKRKAQQNAAKRKADAKEKAQDQADARRKANNDKADNSNAGKAQAARQANKQRDDSTNDTPRPAAASMDRPAERQAVVDTRQNFQAKRIERGVQKGYLTTDEIAQLDAQQNRIADMEKSFTSDGKLTRSEFDQLREELNVASRCIWAQKHDTEGNQMPVYALGRNVFARDEITMPLQNEQLSRDQALTLLQELRRTMSLQKTLATADLPAEDRAKMQAEYDTLINKYFEVRAAPAKAS